MQTQTFKISGMHCTACALNIDLDLEEVSGIVSAKTNYAKSETVIEFDANKIDPATIHAVIAKTGYTASP